MPDMETAQKKILCYPAVQSDAELADLVARLCWHFSHLDVCVTLPVEAGVIVPQTFDVPDYMHADIARFTTDFLPKIQFETAKEINPKTHAVGYDAILKIRLLDKDPLVVPAGTKVYRVDPDKVRQEGSFYIQAAVDLHSNLEVLQRDCQRKFKALKEKLGHFSRAWSVATGPSVKHYIDYNYDDDLVIGCNSVVLNDELVKKTGMRLLVFADPIFHFGVSQYAGTFRDEVVAKLAIYDIDVLIPFKYYPLFVSHYPELADRVIGVPFTASIPFNFDLVTRFQSRTTANVLTLMLLPIASSFADEVVTIGCDGRPLVDDGYFWGHDKSVQINDKMDNIQQVHPGFFKIDYNDYYFEHCHTLENMLQDGEAIGKRFWHAGPSHIPALKTRQLGVTAPVVSNNEDALVVILEPDGIDVAGHYVPWHNNLSDEIRKSHKRLHILCNKKQNPALYRVPATPVFSGHSWGISRGEKAMWRSFSEQPNFKGYCKELLNGLLDAAALHKTTTMKIFIYYGSVQILQAIQSIEAELREKGITFQAVICLFHESVILQEGVTTPRFNGNSGEILTRAVARDDTFLICAVTDRLKDYTWEKFGVRLHVFPNPAPSMGDQVVDFTSGGKSTVSLLAKDIHVAFLGQARREKGAKIISQTVAELGQDDSWLAGMKFSVRAGTEVPHEAKDRVCVMDANMSEEAYWDSLKQADILVIPYLSPEFKYRTSGIIVDAMFVGKPCIVIQDTWLADVVLKYHFGLPVRYYSPTSIGVAITTIRDNYDFFSRNARTAFFRYKQDNSWKDVAGLLNQFM